MLIDKSEKQSDRHRVPETELSDSEDEGDGRRDRRSYKEDDTGEGSGDGMQLDDD
jgi:hypothetical protein